MSFRIDPRTLSLWSDSPGGGLLVPAEDRFAARQGLAPSLDDDASTGLLRSAALTLADGSDLSRFDGHTMVDQLAAALADGRLRDNRGAGVLKMLRLVPVSAPAPPPAPASSAARSSTPGPAPAPAASTFAAALDVAAMVAVLTQAAREGDPLCEICEPPPADQRNEVTPA